MSTYLVTGAGGFIGSHVAEALLADGHAVRIIDNFSTGSRGNLAGLHGHAELIEGDIRSYERTHSAVQGAECVVVASSSSVDGGAGGMPNQETMVPQPMSPYGVSGADSAVDPRGERTIGAAVSAMGEAQ